MNQKDQKEYSQKRHNEARKQYNAGVKQSEKQEAKAKAEVSWPLRCRDRVRGQEGCKAVR